MAATITISGVGFVTNIEVADGETYADALSKAGIDAEAQGLDVSVNGAEVENLDQTAPESGDQVTATPKNASLGS